MAAYSLRLPLSEAEARMLRAGDTVELTGQMLTGRDAAHKRLIALIEANQPLPINLRDQTMYYVGPAPASPGHAVGPAGPTTSYRMDPYTPALLERGLRVMIGKGQRNAQVRAAMARYGAVYLGAVGGAAALISQRILDSRVIAYPDLGPEAIHCFTVKNFPAIVLMDAQGGSLYESGPAAYRLRAE